MISTRGARLLADAPYLVAAHFRCADDPFSAENPAGYVNLGTAENHLLWDVVGPRLAATRALTEHDTHYTTLHGSFDLRSAWAGHLERVHGLQVDPEHLVFGAGCSALLDALAFVLAAEGEGFLVPAPYYSGFEGDLGARAGVRVVPVPLEAASGFVLTTDALEAAHARATVPLRALLLTNPHNPLGRVLPAAELEAAIDWALARGLHVIVDEIYAQSAFSGAPPRSALHREGPVHVLHGFAKDFALSGFKVGSLHTRDAQVRAGMAALALFSPVSTHTQAVLAQLLRDEVFVRRLAAENRRRLREAAARATAALDALGVPYVPPEGGLFLWIDLRAHLGADGERGLHARLFDGAKLNLTPGGAFGAPEAGWFRLCFAQPAASVDEGLRRLRDVLAGA